MIVCLSVDYTYDICQYHAPFICSYVSYVCTICLSVCLYTGSSQPASAELINALPREVYSEEHSLYNEEISSRSCSISQEEFYPGEVLVKLPCAHRFKEDAIVPWLNIKNSCPVCRVPLATNHDT